MEFLSIAVLEILLLAGVVSIGLFIAAALGAFK